MFAFTSLQCRFLNDYFFGDLSKDYIFHYFLSMPFTFYFLLFPKRVTSNSSEEPVVAKK